MKEEIRRAVEFKNVIEIQIRDFLRQRLQGFTDQTGIEVQGFAIEGRKVHDETGRIHFAIGDVTIDARL